ncbi:MAG TPA: methyltransferase domain-containing protein [Xanthobacteraceae bacterium]|jgi:SAM-dependent methyltransferase|nr:methyltransferase domain-containing protein [Xanthobacteraceae bacterium]
MLVDVVDLRSFYTQPVGVVTRRLLSQAIRERWPRVSGMTVAGLGYATPYLGLFNEEAERTLAFMPARQGVIRWPATDPCRSALVEETQLPLPDASMDRVLAVHALELTYYAPDLLREIWRILAANGRLLIIVPNRRGIWARSDATPFGQGRPFSRRQLAELLREALFTPVGWSEALWIPPVTRVPFLRSTIVWERVGRSLSLPFAGVQIVEATKQVFRPIAVKPVKRAKPVLMPAAISRG